MVLTDCVWLWECLCIICVYPSHGNNIVFKMCLGMHFHLKTKIKQKLEGVVLNSVKFQLNKRHGKHYIHSLAPARSLYLVRFPELRINMGLSLAQVKWLLEASSAEVKWPLGEDFDSLQWFKGLSFLSWLLLATRWHNQLQRPYVRVNILQMMSVLFEWK